jgi:hypothetical protein
MAHPVGLVMRLVVGCDSDAFTGIIIESGGLASVTQLYDFLLQMDI